MKKFILKRLLHLLPTLLCVSFLSFLLVQLSASDFVDVMYDSTGTVLSQQAIDLKRIELGLDQPFFTQYVDWLQSILRLDLGTSFTSGESVLSMLLQKLPNTLLLAVTAMVTTLVISIPLGTLAAVYHGKWVDRLLRAITFLTGSIPGFVLAFLLIYLFSVQLRWLPSISSTPSITTLILPTLSLALVMSGKYIRQIRAVILTELQKDYIAGLRTRGISERKILLGSVSRSCLITIFTLFSLSFGSLLGGTAIIESVFMWDGVGKMAVDAVLVKDYPVVQAYVLMMTLLYLLLNLITDCLYCFIDPRIKYQPEVSHGS